MGNPVPECRGVSDLPHLRTKDCGKVRRRQPVVPWSLRSVPETGEFDGQSNTR